MAEIKPQEAGRGASEQTAGHTVQTEPSAIVETRGDDGRIPTEAAQQTPDEPAARPHPPEQDPADRRSAHSRGAGLRGGEGGGVLDRHTIDSIKISVQAILGHIALPVSKLTELEQGELISLETKIGDPIDITANGHLIARGEIVVIEEDTPRFGITITETG